MAEPMGADKSAAIPWTRRPAGTVIIAGEFTSVTFLPYLAGALRAAGCDVHESDINRFMGTSGNKLVDHLLWRVAPRARFKALAASLIETAKTVGADCIVFPKAMGATPRLIDQLEAIGCRSVCWYPDVSFDHPVIDQAALARFHLFITTKAFQMPYLAETRPGLPTMLIEHGYCDTVHRRFDPPLRDEDRVFDCAFVGNHSPHKEQWLQQIIERSPDRRFAIAGARWGSCAWMERANIWRASGPLTGDAMTRLFNHSRMALAIHHGPDGNRHGWEDDVSARTFEIPACGTFMLHIDNAHVRSLFDVPGEIDTFASPEEASAKITQYIAQRDVREAMAQRAWRRTVPAYGYAQRAGDVANAILAMLRGE